jgi:hypothetical protein
MVDEELASFELDFVLHSFVLAVGFDTELLHSEVV